MFDFLKYDFIQKAFLAGIMVAIIIPLIGTVVVNRRTSTLGDALSHTTLAGLFFAIMIGINPILGGILISVASAFLIEFLRYKFPKNGDMATAIVMSLGVGVSSILSDFVTGAQNFESFLFGSIISVTREDLIIIAIITIITLIAYYFLYYGLLFVSVDKISARLSGVNNLIVEYTFTLLLAIVIAISARIVGVLIVSSLMILPVASAMYMSKSYKNTVIVSVIFGIVYFIVGLSFAALLNLKPGGSIIISSVIGLLLVLLIYPSEK
ncbi:MAG: metal ABC transporter permease [Tissierellia bacterium]|nr:metal ABC transporter permease [Tissierellia bacterium]